MNQISVNLSAGHYNSDAKGVVANDVYTPAQLYNIYSLESNLGVENVIQEEAEYLKAANDEEIMKWMGRWLESAKCAEEDQGFVRDEAAGASLSS